MDSSKGEKRLLRYTYLLALIAFINLGFYKGEVLNQRFDYGALVICFVLSILIGYSYFIIRKFFPDGDKYIFVFAAILTVIGIVMLYRIDANSLLLHNTDVANNAKHPYTITNYAIKQVIWFAVGVAGFICSVVLLPDLKTYRKYKYVYMGLTLIFITMASLIGTEINGSQNWVFIGGAGFQPSEFGKIFLVAYLASALKDYDDFASLIQPAIIVMVSLGFMVLQKDLGSALIIFGIAITMLYIATSNLKYILTCFFLFIIGAVVSYNIFDHVRTRVTIWHNPWLYSSGKGYQLVQSLIAIASGGLFGVGLGKGHPEFVPVSESDFIFAVICEDLGLLMGFAIILLYFLLFYRCMRAAIFVEDRFSRLLTVGYSAMIASQVLVIIGGVTGMVPLTGITLPLISYGGSSMLIILFSLGIIQKVSEDSLYE